MYASYDRRFGAGFLQIIIFLEIYIIFPRLLHIILQYLFRGLGAPMYSLG